MRDQLVESEFDLILHVASTEDIDQTNFQKRSIEYIPNSHNDTNNISFNVNGVPE